MQSVRVDLYEDYLPHSERTFEFQDEQYYLFYHLIFEIGICKIDLPHVCSYPYF